MAPRSRNPPTGHRRDSPISSSLFSHGQPVRLLVEAPRVQKYLLALPAHVPLAQVTGGDPSCTEISPGSCTSGSGYWWRPLVHRNISWHCRLMYLWPRLLVETPRVQKYLPALPAPVPLAHFQPMASAIVTLCTLFSKLITTCVINVAKYWHRLYHAKASGRVYDTCLFTPL